MATVFPLAVVMASGCSTSTFCVQVSNTNLNNDAMTFSDSVVVSSQLLQVKDTIPLSEQAILGIFSGVFKTVTTVTGTITNWVTVYANACGGGSVCAPLSLANTSFNGFITSMLIPIITLVLYISIAFAAHVRSFTVLTLFGLVGILMMSESAVIAPWVPLVIVIAIAALTTRVLSSFLGSASIYSTMTFLLLLGSFTGIYANSSPAATVVGCQVTGPTAVNSTLAQSLCSNLSPGLPCIGNILGYCVVSSIINGLTSIFNLFGSVTSSPVSTAITLGIIFLVVGIIAGIAGFGQLMNIVFSVGLGVSLFYFSNAELGTFVGVPTDIYALFNGVIGISELYIFWEAFRGSGGGGASSPGQGSGTSGTGSSAGGGHGTGVT